MRKGEIDCYKQFLLFSQSFPQLNIFSASKCGIVWSWVEYLVFIFSQINVTATDGGSPNPLTSDPVTVRVNVLRNDFDPVFDNLPRIIDRQESVGILSSLFTVQVSDADITVSLIPTAPLCPLLA